VQEEFEDIKGVINIRKSKSYWQDNGHKKSDRRTNNNLQNTTQKTKDRATRTPQNTGAPEGYSVPAPLVASIVLL